jgi:ribosomal protein S15P/S13E
MAEEKKSKSKKSNTTEREKAENIEKVVVDLGKAGYNPAKIGLILKEKHDVPKIKHLGKKIAQILKENNIEYEDNLASVNKKIAKIEVHYEKNKQDKRAKREIVKFIGLRKKLERYKVKKPMTN